MAVIDTNKLKKPFINDRDESVNIGIDLPFRIGERGEGWGAASQTTLEAVANNVKNLVSTELGERLHQPNLGVALRKYLFEPFNQDLIDGVSSSIIEAISYWLPFVSIESIDVRMSDNTSHDYRNVLNVSVAFHLKKDPTTTESVQIKIGE